MWVYLVYHLINLPLSLSLSAFSLFHTLRDSDSSPPPPKLPATNNFLGMAIIQMYIMHTSVIYVCTCVHNNTCIIWYM